MSADQKQRLERLGIFDEVSGNWEAEISAMERIMFRRRVREIRQEALREAAKKTRGGVVTAVSTPVSKIGSLGSNPGAPAKDREL